MTLREAVAAKVAEGIYTQVDIHHHEIWMLIKFLYSRTNYANGLICETKSVNEVFYDLEASHAVLYIFHSCI